MTKMKTMKISDLKKVLDDIESTEGDLDIKICVSGYSATLFSHFVMTDLVLEARLEKVKITKVEDKGRYNWG